MLTCSNKSDQLCVIDVADGLVSPELVASAMAQHAADQDYRFFIRTDFETYSAVNTFDWRDDDNVQCEMQLVFDHFSIVDTVYTAYHLKEKELQLSGAAPPI